MVNPASLLTVFSGRVEDRDGSSVVQLPEREVELGELERGETYRVAILSTDSQARAGAMGSGSSGQRSPGSSGPPVDEGELLEAEIEELGEQGDGIARVGPGYILFVPDTKVGDRVTLEITQVREKFAFGEVVEDEPITG